MRTKSYFIESLINKDVVDNKTTETVTLKDCLSSQTTTTTTASMTDTLYREDNRVKTFVNWPHSFIDPKKLAQTGFSYIGPDDNVKCYFCKAEIGRWEPEDDEVTEHIRWSPNCPLLKRRETNNVPISEADLDRVLPPLTYDVCGPFSRVEMRQGSYAESSFTVPAIETQQQSLRNPEHPEYAIESARIRSYEDWPKTMKQTPKDLSDAGFFYTQTGDRVKCFSCGGGLRDWDENDVPWEQHALWFGKCEYLKLMKGQEYIDAVIAANSEQNQENNLCTDQDTKTINDECNRSSTNCVRAGGSRSVTSAATAAATSSASVSSIIDKDEHSDDKKLCESKLCKICYSCEYNTAFFPCGHVVACAKCASSVTKCPMCRKPFEHVIRVYFS